jgi:RNA polymerase sigma-70 factor (sigma-E family)
VTFASDNLLVPPSRLVGDVYSKLGGSMDEPDGFREFVAARSRALLRTAWLLTGDWAAAQDLVQTALAKTWPAWSRIERSDDPEVYVRRVLVTTYATWWRRRWRAETPSAVMPDKQTSADPFDEADRRAVVAAALSRLSRGQRAVVVLRYFDDLTEAQTAAALGCSVGTVKSQNARALAALRTSVPLAQLVGLIDEEALP